MSTIISISILCVFLSEYVVVIKCAPKLGPILFDPLLYEANLTKNYTNYKLEETRTENVSEANIFFKVSNYSKKFSIDANQKSHNKTSEQISKAKIYLRMSNSSRKISVDALEDIKKPCLGYDFNETLCKTIEDRVVCGYNKNVGDITANKIIHFDNGCRIRGDRLECGYWQGPYINPRRPPARDGTNDDSIDNNLFKSKSVTKEFTTKDTTARTSSFVASRLKLLMTTSFLTETSKPSSTSSTTMQSSPISTNIQSSTSSNTAQSSTILSTSPMASIKQLFKRHCVEKDDHIFCYTIKQ